MPAARVVVGGNPDGRGGREFEEGGFEQLALRGVHLARDGKIPGAFGPVQGVVAQGFDGAFGDDKALVAGAVGGIPKPFLSALGEALEAGVAQLETAKPVAVVVGKDGVAVFVHENLPGKARVGQHGGGNAALGLKVGVRALNRPHGGELRPYPGQVFGNRLHVAYKALWRGSAGRGRVFPYPRP